MKILICVWKLAYGGAERVASLWAQGFVAEGHTVDFLLGSHSSPITYEIPEKTTIYYESIFPDKISARLCPQIYKNYRIKKILAECNPDIVISVMPLYAQKIKRIIKNKNIPIIVTEHNSYERPVYAPMSSKQQKEKFCINNLFDATTVLTQADKNFLIGMMGADFAKKTFVLPNPLTYNQLENTCIKEKIILAVGRIEAWHVKGFDLLLNAWAKIAKKYPDWILKIAGEGDPRDLLPIVEKSDVQNQVEFLGFVDVLPCYQRASIFVLSSRYEGFGMALTEAMSQGCACIACDYKGRQREIIQDDSQGIICPVDDVDALKNAIEKMIVDKFYRRECQKNAVERSKFYALPNIMERWNDIFKKLNLKK